MNDTDLSDNAAIQFLLTTGAGNEKYSVEARALAINVGLQMWHEALNRMWNFHEQERSNKTP